MPVEWKATIVEVARRIPDVRFFKYFLFPLKMYKNIHFLQTTFIWKYERPSDFNNVDRPSNLVCVEWAPQADLLR